MSDLTYLWVGTCPGCKRLHVSTDDPEEYECCNEQSHGANEGMGYHDAWNWADFQRYKIPTSALKLAITKYGVKND